MPNCIGLEYEDALTAMVSAGVRLIPLGYFQPDPVSLVWSKSTAQSGTVTSQLPSAGSVMPANYNTILTVSSFKVGNADDPNATLPVYGIYPNADIALADIARVLS